MVVIGGGCDPGGVEGKGGCDPGVGCDQRGSDGGGGGGWYQMGGDRRRLLEE